MEKQVANITSQKDEILGYKSILEKSDSDKTLNIFKLKNELNRERDYSKFIGNSKEKLENEIRDGGESGMAGHGQGVRLFKKAEGGRRKMKNGNADR